MKDRKKKPDVIMDDINGCLKDAVLEPGTVYKSESSGWTFKLIRKLTVLTNRGTEFMWLVEDGQGRELGVSLDFLWRDGMSVIVPIAFPIASKDEKKPYFVPTKT